MDEGQVEVDPGHNQKQSEDHEDVRIKQEIYEQENDTEAVYIKEEILDIDIQEMDQYEPGYTSKSEKYNPS